MIWTLIIVGHFIGTTAGGYTMEGVTALHSVKFNTQKACNEALTKLGRYDNIAPFCVEDKQ